MRLQFTILLATLSLAACSEYTDEPSSDNWNAPLESAQTVREEEASESFTPAKSMRMRPDLELPEMEELEEDYDDVEVLNATVTAVSCVNELLKRNESIPESCADENDPGGCANKLHKSNYKHTIGSCEPLDALLSGYAIYDRDEQKAYLLDPSSFYRYEFERGFRGTIDINGEVIGKRAGLLVLAPDGALEYQIYPRADFQPFFGGCRLY